MVARCRFVDASQRRRRSATCPHFFRGTCRTERKLAPHWQRPLETTMTRKLLALILLVSGTLMPGRATTVTISVDQPGATINPAMWGVFFEDINFGADGGLYAELVKNRGFEFPEPLMGWAKIAPSLAKGELSVRDDAPFAPGNPHYVRLQSEGTAPFGVSNEGFRGMGVRQGEAYDFSVRVRGVAGAPKLKVQLYGGDGTLLDSVDLEDFTGSWQKYTATLHPKDTDPKARLAVLLDSKGTLDLDFISLFPEHTWKNRAGGLRTDMVQALADLHPGFLRFPGGCIVEGSVLARRYQWKNTIGPVEDRPLLINRWNYEFLHRPTPDYYQSFGLGFFEFFQLCEDIGAQPLPIVNCGMACQFNSAELCPLDQLGTYIQDALDLIEFANGPANSAWGARRAAMGHPEPFNMKLLGVGNEQWGQEYIDRYAKFAQVLKEKHPEISLVSAAGPDPADPRFKFAWTKLRELHADIIDEHSYAKPEWFLDNAHRYDSYDRNGPKVFMGEYAAQSVAVLSTKNRNNLACALAEAAFLTGLERNADVVRMASYAPLFANTEAWQWTPNLIWVDSLRLVRTPNYHVQRLFARNRGDRILPVALSRTTPEEERRVYVSSTFDEGSSEVILKLVNATARESASTVELTGVRQLKSGTLTVMQADDLAAVNSLESPDQVAPRETVFSPSGTKFEITLPANSFTVLRLGVAK
jgi:alpha-N-arabinofuranosidase